MSNNHNLSFTSNLANNLNGQDVKLVVFELAGENYGLEVSSVQSIILLQPITPIPRAPEYVEGVTNLRGKVIPVINLARRLGLAASNYTRQTRIIIGENPEQPIGMVVENVISVTSLPGANIEPISPIVASVDANYVRGVATYQERLLIVLNLENILNRALASPTE